MAKVRRTWRRRLLLLAAASVATLLLAEAVVRTGAWLLHRERGVTFDAALGWRMLPHVEKWGEFWSAKEPGRTNEHGWRDRSRARAKPPGERRLAALGDSFVFGQGVDAPARFTERLEAHTGWQVLNFGCCAYGPDQSVLVFEEHARTFAPDAALLVLFVGNDLDDLLLDRKAGWSKPWFRPRGADAGVELVPPHAGWSTTLRTHSMLAELALQFVERGTPAARYAAELRGVEPVPLLVAVLQRFHAAARAAGTHVLVALAHPCDSSLRSQRDPRTDTVLAALRAAGVDTIDLHAAFAAGDTSAGEPYLPNGHWSAAGHAAVAQLLAAELARRPWFAR